MPRHPRLLRQISIGLVEADQDQIPPRFNRTTGVLRPVETVPDRDQWTRNDIAILGLVEANGNIGLMPFKADGSERRSKIDIEFRVSGCQCRKTRNEKAAAKTGRRID